jgi:hypothetical protein
MKFEARLFDSMTLSIAKLKKMFLAASEGKISFEEYMDKKHNLLLKGNVNYEKYKKSKTKKK